MRERERGNLKNPCKNCPRRGNKTVCYVNSDAMEMCEHYEEHIKYQKILEKNRKYKKGGQIKTIEEFDKIINDNGFVYIGDKIQHAGWVMSMQYRVVRDYIFCGQMKRAIRKDKTIDKST